MYVAKFSNTVNYYLLANQIEYIYHNGALDPYHEVSSIIQYKHTVCHYCQQHWVSVYSMCLWTHLTTDSLSGLNQQTRLLLRLCAAVEELLCHDTPVTHWHASDLTVGEDVNEQRKKRKQSHRPLSSFHKAPRDIVLFRHSTSEQPCPVILFSGLKVRLSSK